VAGHDDAPRVAAVAGDGLPGPLDGGRDVLRAGRPFVTGREPVGDRDADPAVPDRPGAHVVILRGAGSVLVTTGEAATVREQHDGRIRREVVAGVHVEPVPLVRAVADVPGDLRRPVTELVVVGRQEGPAALDEVRGEGRAEREKLPLHVCGKKGVHGLPIPSGSRVTWGHRGSSGPSITPAAWPCH